MMYLGYGTDQKNLYLFVGIMLDIPWFFKSGLSSFLCAIWVCLLLFK